MCFGGFRNNARPRKFKSLAEVPDTRAIRFKDIKDVGRTERIQSFKDLPTVAPEGFRPNFRRLSQVVLDGDLSSRFKSLPTGPWREPKPLPLDAWLGSPTPASEADEEKCNSDLSGSDLQRNKHDAMEDSDDVTRISPDEGNVSESTRCPGERDFGAFSIHSPRQRINRTTPSIPTIPTIDPERESSQTTPSQALFPRPLPTIGAPDSPALSFGFSSRSPSPAAFSITTSIPQLETAIPDVISPIGPLRPPPNATVSRELSSSSQAEDTIPRVSSPFLQAGATIPTGRLRYSSPSLEAEVQDNEEPNGFAEFAICEEMEKNDNEGSDEEMQPLQIEELMEDELLYRAVKPFLKRGYTEEELSDINDQSFNARPGCAAPNEHHRNRPSSSLPPSPSPPPAGPPLPKRQKPGPTYIPLPRGAPFDDDPPPSSDDSGPESDDDLSRYKNPRNQVTLPEFATITQHYLRRRHNLTDMATRDMRDFQEAMKKRRQTLKRVARAEAEKKGAALLEENQIDFLDQDFISGVLDVALSENYEMHTVKIRRAKPLMYESTGIRVEHVHRCPKSCKAFTKRTELECRFCRSPRFKKDGITPTATYPYIKLLPRLRLWFSDPSFLEMMCQYRREAEREKNELTDFWNSKRFKKLKRHKKDGIFQDKFQRDLAFLLTSDELAPYKSKAYYRVTPMVVICYNIPPHIRTKMRFLLVTGFIPGRENVQDCQPNGKAKPQDRQSYFEPLVQEFEQLAKGVPCFDSIEKKEFKLRGHLVSLWDQICVDEKVT